MDEQPNGEEQPDDEAATEPTAPTEDQPGDEPANGERSEPSHHGRRHSGMRRGWKRLG